MVGSFKAGEGTHSLENWGKSNEAEMLALDAVVSDLKAHKWSPSYSIKDGLVTIRCEFD